MKKFILIVLVLVGVSCAESNEYIDVIIAEDSVPVTKFDNEINNETNLKIGVMTVEEKELVAFISFRLELVGAENKWISCFKPLTPPQKRIWSRYWAVMGWLSLPEDVRTVFKDSYKTLTAEKNDTSDLKELLFVFIMMSYYMNNDLDYCVESSRMKELFK
jgi:hypothetical protein